MLFWKKWLKAGVPALITVFNNACRTRWIARLDAFDLFYDLIPAIQAAIERTVENVDDKYSRNKAEKAKPLFMITCPFQTIVKAVMVSMVIHKRSYQEAARFWQRFSRSDEWCKAVKGNFKNITEKYKNVSCSMVSWVFNPRYRSWCWAKNQKKLQNAVVQT